MRKFESVVKLLTKYREFTTLTTLERVTQYVSASYTM